MLVDLIARSRADARSQNLRQFIYVERHLCEREIAGKATEAICEALFYLTGARLPIANLKAVDTSKTMVAWEADARDPDDIQLFDDLPSPAAVKFVTDFHGEVVRITAPIFFQRVTT